MIRRRRAIGAEVTPQGVQFRVWAPSRRRIEVIFEEGARAPLELEADDDGYFVGLASAAKSGTQYRFRLDGGSDLYPDPASRAQPSGPHGPSMVVDSNAFPWSDHAWRGVERRGNMLYEFHVGTFTPAGTWRAAEEKLEFLRDLGVTVLEMMPVNDFPGEFGWGYDGVGLWAPTHLYGKPDDLRHFVDRAHSLGLGVILDVVYNHLGPDGNCLKQFADAYFTDRYSNEWGEALNFDGASSRGVREFFVENAAYWIDEFHFDGLRLDATQSIHDSSKQHVVGEIANAARAAAGSRAVLIVGENEPQEAQLARDASRGGFELALWNDDFHHSAHVAMTGRNSAYYTDHRGTPQELIAAAKFGFLFQGQYYAWQKQRRGTVAHDLDPASLITFLENHDQVANSGRGQRLCELTSPALMRAMTALLLLMPQTPMLFQGEEFAASAPFLYFADHKPELAVLVEKGRREFISQFPSLATEAMQRVVASPSSRETFERCKLDWSEAKKNRATVALHRDLLALRRSDKTIAAQRNDILHGSVLTSQAFLLRWLEGTDDDRLLLVNLGCDVTAASFAEPLLASPTRHGWRTLWSSEAPEYGGCGFVEPEAEASWQIGAWSTTLLAPRQSEKK